MRKSKNNNKLGRRSGLVIATCIVQSHNTMCLLHSRLYRNSGLKFYSSPKQTNWESLQITSCPQRVYKEILASII